MLPLRIPLKTEENSPPHVAIIMDGNGRWASKLHKPRSYGHFHGVKKIREILETSLDRGVQYLTLFAFSTENWNRNSFEVSALMNLFEKYLLTEVHNLKRLNIRLRVIGDRERLPLSLRALVTLAETETFAGSSLTLTLAVSYGGQDEITAAAKRLAKDVASGKLDSSRISSECFAKYLFSCDMPPVDLLIRTGGEQRISNFMLWHLAYSELFFTQTLWPDFTRSEYEKCLLDFNRRERRYGKAI